MTVSTIPAASGTPSMLQQVQQKFGGGHHHHGGGVGGAGDSQQIDAFDALLGTSDTDSSSTDSSATTLLSSNTGGVGQTDPNQSTSNLLNILI